MSEHYNVVIDFHSEGDHDPHEVLDHHIHTEGIGQDLYQVGMGIVAHSPDRAYLKATNLLTVEMLAYTEECIEVIETYVHGPEDEGGEPEIYG